MTTCVALLRGINVGRAKRLGMAELREVVESLGHTNVRTLLNSGNVVFDAKRGSLPAIARSLEAAIQTGFGFAAPVIVVTAAEVDAIVRANPCLAHPTTRRAIWSLSCRAPPPWSRRGRCLQRRGRRRLLRSTRELRTCGVTTASSRRGSCRRSNARQEASPRRGTGQRSRSCMRRPPASWRCDVMNASQLRRSAAGFRTRPRHSTTSPGTSSCTRSAAGSSRTSRRASRSAGASARAWRPIASSN